MVERNEAYFTRQKGTRVSSFDYDHQRMGWFTRDHVAQKEVAHRLPQLTEGLTKARPWPALVVIASVKNRDLKTPNKGKLIFIQSL